MKILSNFGLGSIILASILLSGCDSAKEDVNKEKVFTVERGPLLNAKVTDANGQLAIEVIKGRYLFTKEVTYPVNAIDGYIDTNYNGKIEKGEIKNSIELQTLSGDVITIATSLFTKKDIQTLLENDFNISSEIIKNKTPFSSKKIEALSNIVYSYMINNSLSSPSQISTQELKTLLATFNSTLNEYQSDNKKASQHEQDIMSTLSVDTLTDSEALNIQNIIDQEFIENKNKNNKIFEQIIGGFEIDTDDGNGSDIIKPPLTNGASGTTLAGADPIVDENGNLVLDTDNSGGVVVPPNITNGASGTTLAGADPIVDENGNLVLDTDSSGGVVVPPNSASGVCTEIYTPVCASVQVECITAPCENIKATYSNLCELNNDSRASLIHDGEC